MGRRLEGAGIAYMVTGSVALAVYSRPRMTRDVDIVVAVEPRDASRLAALFDDEFLLDPDDLRHALERRGLCCVIHNALLVKIDLIVRKDSPYRRTEFDRRRRLQVDGEEMWVVAPEDLILSKLDWARESRSDFQLRDVRLLLDSVEALDREYMRTWSRELGVDELLREVRTP